MKCTHVALQVRGIERSIAFYRRYCGLRVVHDRTEDFRVVWLAWTEPPQFVIVLLHAPYERNEQPPWQHVGIAVDRREQVDQVYARAADDPAAQHWPPRDAGPIVGYYCALRDPDGNTIEFSHGQRIG